jgi:hypothetical protein
MACGAISESRRLRNFGRASQEAAAVDFAVLRFEPR